MLLDNVQEVCAHSIENSANFDLVGINDLPLRNLALGADEVHLWHATLDEQLVDRLELLLSQDELSRANRFHFPKDRNHFIVARGLLRKLLAAYLGIGSGELRFSYGERSE